MNRLTSAIYDGIYDMYTRLTHMLLPIFIAGLQEEIAQLRRDLSSKSKENEELRNQNKLSSEALLWDMGSRIRRTKYIYIKEG